MRTVQLRSIMKLMLPPAVSSGQNQIMESRIAIVEHIEMTDRAMIGPQWHNLRTSWRFWNVTKVDRKFIFQPQGKLEYFRLGSWIVLTKQVIFSPQLFCKVSGADDARIFSRLLSTQQLAWSWVTGALLVPLFLALAKSSILSCQSSEHTILVTDWNSPSERTRERDF